MSSESSRLERAAKAIEKLPPLYRFALLTILMAAPIVAVVILRPRLLAQAEAQADDWLADVRHYSTIDATPLRHPPDVPDAVAHRLDAQLLETRGSARYHVRATRYFLARQYMFVTIATLAAVIAGVLLVPISWQGLQKAQRYLSTPFLVFAGVAALFTTLNQLYQPAENATNNANMYFAYLSLEDELMSYYPRVVSGDTTAPSLGALIVHVDQRLAELRNFAVGFDQSKIPDVQAVSSRIGAGGGID